MQRRSTVCLSIICLAAMLALHPACVRAQSINETLDSAKLPPLGQANEHGLRVIDREIHHVFGPEGAKGDDVRPLPVDESCMTAPITDLPETIVTPYGDYRENVVYRDRRSLNANIYQKPGTPYVVHLAILTPNTDDTIPGARTYKSWYRVSQDGGETYSDLRPLVVQGDGFDLMHPLPGVWIEKNSFNIDYTRTIVPTGGGRFLVPVGSWPLDEKTGKPYRPRSTSTFGNAGVLIGRFTDDGGDVVWEFGDWASVHPLLSSRGLSEPSVALLPDGRLMMIARGSNSAGIISDADKWIGSWTEGPGYVQPAGYKWQFFSDDLGDTWTEAQPLTWSDGEHFFSPASHSTLVRSSHNGRLYWIGNINTTNPNGNRYRYPLVIAEVDESSGGLIKSSLLVLDTQHPEYDSANMQLSNFNVYECRDTGRLIIELRRLDYNEDRSEYWRVPSWYVIGVPDPSSDADG